MKGSAKIIRGNGTAAGGGIYFAHTPRETEWKADCRPEEDPRVVLECRVRMGKTIECGRYAPRNTNFSTLVNKGYDSVILDRSIPEGAHKDVPGKYPPIPD